MLKICLGKSKKANSLVLGCTGLFIGGRLAVFRVGPKIAHYLLKLLYGANISKETSKLNLQVFIGRPVQVVRSAALIIRGFVYLSA